MPVNKIFHSHLILLLLWVFITAEAMSQNPYPPQFTNPPENTVDAGHIKLIWAIDHELELEETTFELQQATDSLFADKMVIYKGPDLATFISGLKNDIYYFRIRAIDKNNGQSDWSETVLVTVQHHSLNMAFTLFSIGAVVFLLTCFVVIKGATNS